MSVYLDTSVLIPFLYEETEQREKAESVKRLFQVITNRQAQALITFYTLPELYNYVAENYSIDQVNETLRVSLAELFSAPLIVKPFVDRVDVERLRRRFAISDPSDVFHVVAAIHYDCSAIITFDHHFQQVANVIPAYTPDEFLATLGNTSDAQ
jgi:predicted nucleic acid-binding protein